MMTTVKLPYKSVAAALIFSILFGPIGLLYGTFWGGMVMIAVGIIVLSSKLFFTILLFWLFCCIWAVGAVELHNKKIYQGYIQTHAETNHTS